MGIIGEQGGKNPRFTRRSWTHDPQSYINAAEKEAKLLIRNSQHRPYLYAANLSIHQSLTDEEHKQFWAKFTRSARRKGLVFYWVREWNGDMTDPWGEWHLHYHLIIAQTTDPDPSPVAAESTPPTPAECDPVDAALLIYRFCDTNPLRCLLRECIPSHHLAHVQVWVEPIRSTISWARYITKAKHKDDNGKDQNRHKRELFTRGLRKIGVVGKFWFKSKAVLWREIIEETRQNQQPGRMEVEIDQQNQQPGRMEVEIDQQSQQPGRMEGETDRQHQSTGRMEGETDEQHQPTGRMEVEIESQVRPGPVVERPKMPLAP